MKTPEYRTRRLIIRPLRTSDYKTWLHSQEVALPKINKYDLNPIPPERRTRAVFAKNVIKQQRQSIQDVRWVWNIFKKDTGELIGFIDLNTVSR